MNTPTMGNGKALPPHLALMEAIKKRQQPGAEPEVSEEKTPSASGGQVNSRIALMDALKNRKQQQMPSEQSDGLSGGGASNLNDSRSALMAAITKRQQQRTVQEDHPADDGQQQRPEQAKFANPRAALLAAIQKRTDRPPSSPSAVAAEPDKDQSQDPRAINGNSHMALLAAIRKKQDVSEDDSGSSSSSSAVQLMNPQAALLAAIQRGRSKPPSSCGDGGTNANLNGGAAAAQYEPCEYTMDSKFIVDMRQRLLEIKTAYEDLEMTLETMNSAWEATARYLGEDPSGSSSEYIFNLLNRFRLDVKVVKSLLFRKGLSFASDLQALLPNARTCSVLYWLTTGNCCELIMNLTCLLLSTDVGSTIATIYGPGVVTALRVADKRIEVKFPWSREAYLSPNCILSAGTLVHCRPFGVGIIRETYYDSGFCCVRFAFGYGMIQVRDIGPETSSNASSLRREILQTPFCVGDPVLTPFGCGHIRSIQKRFVTSGGPREALQRDGVVEVRLLSGDLRSGRSESQEERYAGTAFVHFRHATLNY